MVISASNDLATKTEKLMGVGGSKYKEQLINVIISDLSSWYDPKGFLTFSGSDMKSVACFTPWISEITFPDNAPGEQIYNFFLPQKLALAVEG